MTDKLCSYCSSPLAEWHSPDWLRCENHLPVEVMFWVGSNTFNTPYTLMYVYQDGWGYSLVWEKQQLILYSHEKAVKLLEADIPLTTPEQASALLRRLMNNMAFI